MELNNINIKVPRDKNNQNTIRIFKHNKKINI